MVPNTDVSACTQPTTNDDAMLSKLPTDLLVSILEKLSLRDAVRAGVLSRRWRHLPGQLPRLDLDLVEFLPEEGEFSDQDDPNNDMLDMPSASSSGHSEDDDALSAAGDKMLDVATALLASRAAGHRRHLPTIAMSFLLRHNYRSLGRLLDDAMASGKVRAAELKISTSSRFGKDNDDMDGEEEERLLRTLVGYGRRFRWLFDGCPAVFGGLTQLTMEKMTVREVDLHDILTTCTRLELLSLYACVCTRFTTTQWRFRHARLADLRISSCFVRAVYLAWLPRLERFAYRYCEFLTHQPLSFGHVPRLTTLTIYHTLADREPTVKLSHILANTAVTELRLNFRGRGIWIQPEAPKRLTDVFGNLKYLNVRNVHEASGLSWTMVLLQAAPFLKELYIKLWDHECGMQPDQNKNCFPVVKKKSKPCDAATDFKHYSLTRITIQGFYSTKDILITHIRRLVQAAVNLEELSMRENAACKHCEDTRTGFPQIDEEKEWLMKRITDGGFTPFKIHIVAS